MTSVLIHRSWSSNVMECPYRKVLTALQVDTYDDMNRQESPLSNGVVLRRYGTLVKYSFANTSAVTTHVPYYVSWQEHRHKKYRFCSLDVDIKSGIHNQ